MRACEPIEEGFVERDGVRVAYEVYGEGRRTVFLMPIDTITHARAWKGQIPYLARAQRVVTFDPRGNGRSDRPRGPDAYANEEFAADAMAVMDETGTERAVFASVCSGVRWSMFVAAAEPHRVQGLVSIGGSVPLTPPHQFRATYPFDQVLETDEAWAKENRHYWAHDWRGYVEFFFGELVPEPHSSKLREDVVGWAMDTDAETHLFFRDVPRLTPPEAEELCRQVRCPVMVVHGELDACQPIARSERMAELFEVPLVVMQGAGHLPQGRDPVATNLMISGFVDEVASAPTAAPVAAPAVKRWTRALDRRRRVLYLSSPIGLGHANRDLAIARALRVVHPDVQVEWLTQHPVTRVLEAAGETIHPASRFLANESKHFETESGEHDLHAFQAIRNMDEIMVANFMLFHDVVREDQYDLVVGDEAWDVDHFLFENPELKNAAFVWMTDFVGWIPMPDGGTHEASLTADYNAEMIEHVERYPRLRDRAVFVGNPDDVVPGTFGPGLPGIREWTEAHYDFSGYVTGFDPAELGERDELRWQLGFSDDEKVCIVTVGGSGVGEPLLRKVIAAYGPAKRSIPELRMIVVAGPRIDPSSLPAHEGLEVRAYVDGLYRHLAACDLAVVQGGLTTTMELTAARRPFLYFPLRHHFEQSFHVRHRLDRYGAGRCMDYDDATPDALAEAMAVEMVKQPDYLPVESGGAERAAALIAGLL